MNRRVRGTLVTARIRRDYGNWIRGYVSKWCRGYPGDITDPAFDFDDSSAFVVLESDFHDREWKCRCSTRHGPLWFVSAQLDVVAEAPPGIDDDPEGWFRP